MLSVTYSSFSSLSVELLIYQHNDIQQNNE
jgi:hypothetical protein